jgi:RNA-binding protein
VVQVGKEGVSTAVAKQALAALHDHELIKVKIGSECPQSRFEVAERLADEPGINVVQILGRVVVLYKRHPEEPVFEASQKKPDTIAAPKKAARKPLPRRPAPESKGRSRSRRR